MLRDFVRGSTPREKILWGMPDMPGSSQTMTHDLKLTVSVGTGRKDTRWVPQETTWSNLVRRLSPDKLVRTGETAAQYQRMTRTQRNRAKDVGGFVGGTVQGRRKNGNVQDRTLITLDADYATDELWPKWASMGFAGCAYSTHSHTPESPRLRLVIPLLTPIDPTLYEPLARKVASWLGMDLFDDTTYQATRLMYWPNASKDGEYFYEVADALILDPQAVLAEYTDPKNPDEWPRSSRQQNDRRRPVNEKASDPTTKEGWIGAFCRAYNVVEAIEKFIPDVYTPSDTKNRYTYTKGSVPEGLVIYSDYSEADHAYSWHDTDPAKGHSQNAFDLVRIHKFGGLDAIRDEDLENAPGSRASHQAMIALCEKDEAVQAEYLAARRGDFTDPPDPVGAEPLPSIISAAELQQTDLPPVRWVVEKILPYGEAFLTAPPKYYKSWFVLHLGICVALGAPFLGFRTHKSPVLYLALEDSLSRLKGRSDLILRNYGGFAPSNLFYSIKASTIRTGLFEEMDTFLAAQPDCKLVIVDIFQKVRDGPLSRQEGPYQADTREAGALKAFADSRGICVLIVHHTNKRDGDSVSRMSGTNGIAGAADTLWSLEKKKRSDLEATFNVTGRDVDAAEYAISFNKEQMVWTMLGDREDVAALEAAKRYGSDPIVQTVRDLLTESNPWSGSLQQLASEIETRHDITYSTAALGKALRALAPELLSRDSITHEIGTGRARRTHRLAKCAGCAL